MTILTGFQLPEPLAPGSPEWLGKYSASQVAAICGLSKWDTPRSMFDAKAGIVPPQPQTSVMGRGHEFEPLMRKWFADMHPDWTVEDGTGITWQHAIREWQIVNLDGTITTDTGDFELYEGKTADDIQAWGDTPPIYYLVQGMWAMDVTGAKRMHLAACGPFELFHRRPKVFVIEYDPYEAALLRERVLEFDANLRNGIQPPADHSMECDRLAVRYANTGFAPDPGLEIPDELAVPYLEAFAAQAEAEAQKKATASQLLEYMRSQKKATYRGHTIATRVNGKGDNPPSLRATNGLADKAADILNTSERTAA